MPLTIYQFLAVARIIISRGFVEIIEAKSELSLTSGSFSRKVPANIDLLLHNPVAYQPILSRPNSKVPVPVFP